MKYDVISFDFVGTLAYETKGERILIKSILNELGLKVDIQRIRRALEETKEWWRSERAKGVIWNESSRLDYVRVLLSNLGINHQDRNLAMLVAQAWPEVMELRAYEDTKPTLEILRSMGFRLILLSNVSSEDNLRKYVTKVELSRYFESFVASGSIGFEKPDIRIFLAACTKAKTNPENMIHVGDDYEKDYLGALRSGLRAVLIDRAGKHQEGGLLKIMNLTELPDVIRGLSR